MPSGSTSRTAEGRDSGGAATHDIQITNNRIARLYFPNGGSYGPVTAFDPNGPGNVWSGNVWDDAPTVAIKL